MLGARPSTIKALLALEYSDKEIRGNAKSIAARFGIGECKRGKTLSPKCVKFMRAPSENYHASVLIALALRVNLAEAIATGTYADHLIEIYQYYLIIYNGSIADKAVVSFDVFMEVINGVRDGDMHLRTCDDCGGQSLVHSKAIAVPGCPFCAAHQHVHYPHRSLQQRVTTPKVRQLRTA